MKNLYIMRRGIEMKYHHIGIPTTEKRGDERYLAHLKMAVSGDPHDPFGIEWMRFDADAPYPDLVKTVPHIAFEVKDLRAAIRGKKIIIPPNSPSSGVQVAFIEHNGAPVEFLQIDR